MIRMTMKKILSLTVLALVFCGSANAIVVQKALLKNGTILYGYVQQQDGTGKIIFHTDSAIISIDGRCTEVTERSADADNGVRGDVVFLSDTVAYDSKNPTFEGLLRENHRRLSDVIILEKGERVKYLERSPNTYVFTWKDIIDVETLRRPKTALSGIDRVCTMKNGQTFEGQYAGETEDCQKIYLTNGVIQSYKINDVVKYTYKGINPNQDLFAQSELIDIIKVKSGSETRGIITEQNYSNKKDTENYFLVQQQSGSVQRIRLSDIVETRKEENSSYTPKFDILLKSDEVVINRQEVVQVNVKENGDFLVLDSISEKVVLDNTGNSTKFIVEYHSDNGNNVERYQVIRLTKREVKSQPPTYGFSYRDLVNIAIRPANVETSVNNTTKAEYTVFGTGIYALYDARARKAIPFRVR